MRKIMLIIALLLTFYTITIIIIDIVLIWRFKIHCEHFLKLAADAPTVELADKYLEKVVSYILKRNLTQGNTAYFIKTPENDLSLWSRQIFEAANLVRELTLKKKEGKEVTPLEESNVLMRIRQTILDEAGDRPIMTIPDYIHVYPNQHFFLFSELLGIIFAILAWVYFALKRGWILKRKDKL